MRVTRLAVLPSIDLLIFRHRPNGTLVPNVRSVFCLTRIQLLKYLTEVANQPEAAVHGARAKEENECGVLFGRHAYCAEVRRFSHRPFPIGCQVQLIWWSRSARSTLERRFVSVLKSLFRG